MRLDIVAALDGSYEDLIESRIAVARGGMMKAAGLAGREVLGRLRRDVTAAGMGTKLSNTWRSAVYPARGRQSLEPTVVLFSRAPRIVAAYNTGATIRPVRGSVYLWIPTEYVPRSRKRLTPQEVEQRFGAKLTIIPSLTRPGVMLAVIKAVRSKNQRGFRKATSQRLASGRDLLDVPMFILVRQVRVAKRLNIDRIAAEAAALWPDIVARSLVEAFRNDPDPA